GLSNWLIVYPDSYREANRLIGKNCIYLTLSTVSGTIILSPEKRFIPMKKNIIFILMFFSMNSLLAGDAIHPSRQKYIEEHKIDAIRDMQKTEIPASITLAQACLESKDGTSTLATEANNHFGIKCSNWS